MAVDEPRSRNANAMDLDAVTDEEARSMARPGLPVCLVTGFLGAGKTTFLNHLLANSEGLRAAVFVNEFGAVDIDSSLIRWQSAIDEARVVTLDNGCMCCEVNADLAGKLRRVLRDHGKAIDLIIIETSGVCDPGPVLSTLEQLDGSEGVAMATHLDCVLAVVDAAAYDGDCNDVSAQLGLQETARAQLAHSDLVLLNKCDLIGGSSSKRAGMAELALLSSLQPRSIKAAAVATTREPLPRVIRTEHSAVELALITDLVRVLPSSSSGDAAQPRKRRRQRGLDQGTALDHKQEHAAGALRAKARSFAYVSNKPFDPLKFEAWLERGGPPASVCRAKGLLWMQGIPRHVIFQLAGKRTNPFETAKGGGEPSGSKIVFIGEACSMQDGDETVISTALDACLC